MGETTKFPVGSIASNFYLQTLEHSDIIRHFANFHLSNLKDPNRTRHLARH